MINLEKMNDQKRRRKEIISIASGSEELLQFDSQSQDGVGGGGVGGGGGGVKKTKELKEIITSLILLEEQEKKDFEVVEEEKREEKVFLESNHEKQSRIMLDYYADMQDYHNKEDIKEGVKRRNARANNAMAVTTAVVSAVVDASESDVTALDASAKVDGGDNGDKAAVKGTPQRRLWVKNRSKAWWDLCNSPEFPDEEFKKAFRMGKDTFETICNELSSVVAKENTMLRDAVPVRQRVAVCIWRLATGEPLRLVSKRFGLGISTCHKLVLEVCAAIKTVLMPKYLQWPDDDTTRRIKREYESISNIPKVVGSMYTTHIPIIAPKISVAAYFNKRHTDRNQKTSYSITVQGVVDPRGVFTDICIGWPGSMPDDQVLEKSALFQRANQGLLNDVWIVGGSGYPLMDWVLVPYIHQNLTWTQHAFNEKIRDVQRISRDAFARLKGRWSCLQKRTEVKLQDLPVVLGACCVLHNICELRNEEMDPELFFNLVDDDMIPETAVQSAEALKKREEIAHYLLHHSHAGTSFV